MIQKICLLILLASALALSPNVIAAPQRPYPALELPLMQELDPKPEEKVKVALVTAHRATTLATMDFEHLKLSAEQLDKSLQGDVDPYLIAAMAPRITSDVAEFSLSKSRALLTIEESMSTINAVLRVQPNDGYAMKSAAEVNLLLAKVDLLGDIPSLDDNLLKAREILRKQKKKSFRGIERRANNRAPLRKFGGPDLLPTQNLRYCLTNFNPNCASRERK